MRYLTARKRAEGKGASHTGTEHHWYMTVSSVALAFLVRPSSISSAAPSASRWKRSSRPSRGRSRRS